MNYSLLRSSPIIPLANNAIHRAVIRYYPVPASSRLQSDHRTFVIKDNISVKGYPTTAGIAPPALPVASETAPVVEILRRSGDTLLAAANLDPGALGASGTNCYWGDVATERELPGPIFGSSSGSAALVTDKYADYSLVTDVAGSARAPCIHTDTFGLKFSRNSGLTEGILQIIPKLDSLGVIARTLEDLNHVARRLIPTKIPLKRYKIFRFFPEDEEPSLSSIKPYFDTSKFQQLEENFTSFRQIFRLWASHLLVQCNWISKPIRDPHLQALISIQKTSSLEKLEQRIDRLKNEMSQIIDFSSQSSSTLAPIFVFTVSSNPDYSKLPERCNWFLLSNLFGWPALVAPICDSIIHLSGPVTEFDLFEALRAL